MARKPLQRRVAATQATFDRFQGKPFKFGRNDCAQMVAWHLRRMGRPVKAGKAGTYHSALGAAKALKRLGHDNLASLMDAHFERIAWAAALPGDIILMPAVDDQEGIGALAIALGNGRALLYHQDAAGAVPAQVVEAVTAWRVIELGDGAPAA